jgi:hypothetical protein
MMETGTSGTRPRMMVYTMDGQMQVHPNRPVEKAVYCTCWDGDVIVEVDSTGTNLVVRTSQP